MRKRAYSSLLLLVCCLLFTTNSAIAAQIARAEITVILHVPQQIVLNPSTKEIVFSETDFYQLGIYQPEGILVTKGNVLGAEVAGNIGYQVIISALSNSLTSDSAEMPMANFKWRLHSEEGEAPRPWQDFTTDGVLIVERNGAGKLNFSLDFQMLATWDVSPATYSGMILLTVIPQE